MIKYLMRRCIFLQNCFREYLWQGKISTKGKTIQMIKYLTTQGSNYYLEELLKNATSTIILISPYIQLQQRIKDILKEKKQANIKISIVCRKKDLKENITEYSTNIYDVPTLHGKCYINEQEAIITSLNLYEFSQQNNEEMGVYVKNENIGKELYKEILKDAKRLCRKGSTPNPPNPPNHTQNTKTLKINTKYSLEQLDLMFDFGYKGPAGIRKSKKLGDILLFSNTSSTQYKDKQKNDVIYFQGQNTGGDKQELKYGNKDLYDVYENKEIKIHLFKDYVYIGEHIFLEKPYLDDNGKWVFPLVPK